jgi:anti-sigma regulatory factor (Ser/Thr protein kinase)
VPRCGHTSPVRSCPTCATGWSWALDEMASNALRHGGGHVRASVRPLADAWLIEVRDGAPATPPTPAVDRDPSEGGLGLYLIAELATDHGWYVTAEGKHVWAVLTP